MNHAYFSLVDHAHIFILLTHKKSIAHMCSHKDVNIYFENGTLSCTNFTIKFILKWALIWYVMISKSDSFVSDFCCI